MLFSTSSLVILNENRNTCLIQGILNSLPLPHELVTVSQKEVLVLKVAHDKFTWNGGEIPYIGRYSGLKWNTLA